MEEVYQSMRKVVLYETGKQLSERSMVKIKGRARGVVEEIGCER